MLQFVKRLTTAQIMNFFYGVDGGFYARKPSASEGMEDIFFQNKSGKIFWYSIADNYICADGFSKTSEDWKFYMLGIFGDEYLKEYAEKPINNSFVEKLTTEQIKEFLEMNQTMIASIKEEKAFRQGTRRFKVIVKLPTYYRREIIIGPHIDDCDGMAVMTESAFMRFFTKIFGMDFINYYIDIEKRRADDRVKSFKEKCDKRVKDKLNYMVKIMENN